MSRRRATHDGLGNPITWVFKLTPEQLVEVRADPKEAFRALIAKHEEGMFGKFVDAATEADAPWRPEMPTMYQRRLSDHFPILKSPHPRGGHDGQEDDENAAQADENEEGVLGPALTDEQWGLGDLCFQTGFPYLTDGPKDVYVGEHGVVAKMMHGRPFGFTREDVDDERQAYHDAVALAGHYQDAGMGSEQHACVERARRHKLRADRIASFLPPVSA